MAAQAMQQQGGAAASLRPPTRAQDITAVFTEACSFLEPAELVKSPFFTMYESMGAIEVMDPKMDSGYVAPGETLDDDYDVSRDLSAEEVIGIMDQLLCHEAAWHMGHSISQTLYTSAYIDRLVWPVPSTLDAARFDRPSAPTPASVEGSAPSTLPDSSSPSPLVSLVLRAYCLALLKACDRVHSRVTSEYFYEEEDFASALYNRKLLSDVATTDIVAVVDEALAWLETVPDPPTSTDSQQPPHLRMGSRHLHALTSRLMYRRNILLAVDEDLSVLRSRDTSCFEAARQHLEETLTSVSAVGTRNGSEHEEGVLPISKAVPEAFNTKFQRKLASTAPPKPIVDTISLNTAVAFLAQLCTDSIDLVGLVTHYDGPESLFATTNIFMSRRRPGHSARTAQLGREPCVYVRSLAQAMLFHEQAYRLGDDERHLPVMPDSGRAGSSDVGSSSAVYGGGSFYVLDGLSLPRFVHDSLAELVLPNSRNNALAPGVLELLDPENAHVEHPDDPRFRISSMLNEFVDRLAPTLTDMYRSLCLNRCRVRRFMTHIILDWDIIQAEAENIDARLQQLTREPGFLLAAPGAPEHASGQATYSLPLSSWVYHHKLRLMRQIIQMGFELDIYAPQEIAGLYYHLSQVCAAQIAHTDRTRACVLRHRRKWQSTSHTGTGRRKQTAYKGAAAETEAQYDRTLAQLDRVSVEAVVTDAFAIAMHALFTILMRYDLLPTLRRIPWTREADRPEQQAKEAALRYELRMKPFSPITIPEVMPFDIFRAAAEMESDSDQEVMERASRAIAETKRGLEHYISLVTNMQSQSGSPSAPAAARGPTPTVFRDWLADAKDCMRACIGASLAISMVGKAMKEAAPTADGRPPLPLHVDIPSDDDKMRYHPWWAVPRITPAPLGS